MVKTHQKQSERATFQKISGGACPQTPLERSVPHMETPPLKSCLRPCSWMLLWRLLLVFTYQGCVRRYCSESMLAFPWTEVSKATQKANGGLGSA